MSGKMTQNYIAMCIGGLEGSDLVDIVALT